jgi:hypothetical protein
MNVLVFSAVLVICLLVMHTTTLIVLTYRSSIEEYLRTLTLDEIAARVGRRAQFVPRYRDDRPPAFPLPDAAFDDRPCASALPWAVESDVSNRAMSRVQPMYDETRSPFAPVDRYQQYLHPAFGSAISDADGTTPVTMQPAWDVATMESKRAASALGSCKNYMNFSIS